MHIPGDLLTTKHIESLLIDINSHMVIKQQTRSTHSCCVVSDQRPFICLQLVNVELTLRSLKQPLHHYTLAQVTRQTDNNYIILRAKISVSTVAMYQTLNTRVLILVARLNLNYK